MKPAPPVISSVPKLDRSSLRIHKGEPQLLRERIDRRAAALPGTFSLEADVADPAAPGRNGPADGPEVRPIRVVLIEPPNDVRRHADKRPERRRRLDAVLPA